MMAAPTVLDASILDSLASMTSWPGICVPPVRFDVAHVRRSPIYHLGASDLLARYLDTAHSCPQRRHS